MLIREINENDLTECGRIYSRVFSAPPWEESWSASTACHRLEHFYHSKGFIGLLAQDKDITAFVMGNTEPFLDDNWYYLREMCVDTPYQNRGIGSLLLSELDKKLMTLNVRNIYLTTDKHIHAAQFYLNNGFDYRDNMGFYSKHAS